MEIKPPANDVYTVINRSTATSTSNSVANNTPPDWKVAQLIQAIITQITAKQLMLDIQGIKANTLKPNNLDLQIGDILKLQIEQLKPMPQFKIIGLQKASSTTLITQALKNLVAQNTEIKPLLENIRFIANRPALRPSPLPVDVNAAVRDIFKSLPSMLNLKTATQLKNQLQNSGVYLENKIRNQLSYFQNPSTYSASNISITANSNTTALLELDLGAQLRRLAILIRHHLVPEKNTAALNQNKVENFNPVNPKNIAQTATRVNAEQASLQTITQRDEAMQIFLRQIESGLSHLQQTQLQNLNDSQTGRPLWLMELPIKNGQEIDLFELRITEEESTQEGEENKKIWNVTLQFDLTGLGKIKVHIKMQNEYISAQFFSDQPNTLALFRENFDFLRSRLNYNGLNVGNIECSHANLAKENITTNSNALDERI